MDNGKCKRKREMRSEGADARNSYTSVSEVAHLRLLIEREYEAAEHLRSSLAITARHAFITARMENIGWYHEQLIPLVGEDEAARLLCETFSGGDSSRRSE